MSINDDPMYPFADQRLARDELRLIQTAVFIKTEHKNPAQRDWCVFGGVDSSGYVVMLQQIGSHKRKGSGLMVRIGCRFLTLAEARKHYSRKHYNPERARCVLFLIYNAVAIAKSRGLLDKRFKFNATQPKTGRVARLYE